MSKLSNFDPELYKIIGLWETYTSESYRRDLFIDNPSGPYAMDAIREVVKKGQPIPDELIPWVLEACSAWEEKKGNKQRANSKETDLKWSQAITAVWREYMAGRELEDALGIVASMYSCESGTLRAKYYSAEGKHCREALAEEYHAVYSFLVKYPAEADHGFPEKAEELEKQFPRLFK